MPNVVLTETYDFLLSSTLKKVRPVLEDQIATSTALLHAIMRKQEGGYVGESSLGERLQVPLMYELTPADSYAGLSLAPLVA